MVHKQIFLPIVLLGILVVGVSATGDLGEFGAREELIGAAGGLIGYAVAVSGDYALIGQPYYPRRGIPIGAAYVYERRAGQWVQAARLHPSDTKNASHFGRAVAIDGNIAIVGAEGEDAERGAAYLFERREGVWTRVQKLTLSNTAPRTYFGQSVALAGAYAMVGAPGEAEGGSQSGAVYVFERQQGVWSTQPIQKLFASDAHAYYGFGAQIAMAGSYALVGSPEHDAGGSRTANYGAAYIFELDRGAWLEVAKLQTSDRAPKDRFGTSVAITAQEAVVGADGVARRSAAYLFARQAGVWTTTEVQKLTVSDGDDIGPWHVGVAVALSDNILLVGAPDLLGLRPGVVHVFARQAAGWMEVEQVRASQSQLFERFGFAIALGETHVLVGAPGTDTRIQGRVYAYSDFRRNAVPEITSTPQTAATVGTLYTYDVQALDADGDPLSYALTSAPTDMVIDVTSGRITWSPTAPGIVSVVVEVSDDHAGTATQTYTITVSVPNQPPRIISTPVTSAEVFHVVPQVTISDARLARQTITLNGQPYTPGTAITVDGDYILTVEATDVAGNTSVQTLRFTIRRPPAP